mgnify:CR=1 FL=1
MTTMTSRPSRVGESPFSPAQLNELAAVDHLPKLDAGIAEAEAIAADFLVLAKKVVPAGR